MTNAPSRLARTADLVEIQNLINRIAQSVDRCDWEAMLECFHPGARDNHGTFDGTIEEFAEWAASRHSELDISKHHISNIVVDLIDEGSAVVESYCLVWQALPSDTGEESRQDIVATSRYVDIATRIGDGPWKLAERTVIFEASQIVDASRSVAEPGSTMIIGRRDEEDFLWRARGTLRNAFSGEQP